MLMPQSSKGSSNRSRIAKLASGLIEGIYKLSVADKMLSIVALLVVVTILLVTTSFQSMRLQYDYRHLLANSTSSAVNVGRANALIYAVVMESRGIYMSSDPATVKRFADGVFQRNRELADVLAQWEKSVRPDDAERFAIFKSRIEQFIEFRRQLASRAIEINSEAARKWGDNNVNRALRSQLNADLEALAKIYASRATEVAELGDLNRYATWYLFALGLVTSAIGALLILVTRTFVTRPLSEMSRATDSIAAGRIEIDIPFVERKDEIGHLARAVQNFRAAVIRNSALEQLELGTAKQRDLVIGERDRLQDKYIETKWQLHAALNNIAQGLVMIDAKAKILMTNGQFKKMYQLPAELFGPDCTLTDVLAYRAEKGLFAGNVRETVATILARMAKGVPSVTELSLADGRIIRVSEQPMDGAAWVSTHEDFTEQRRAELKLARTERLLATIIENIGQAIVARDARDQRYIFVNKAAEKLFGLPRDQIVGRSPRDLFPAESADIIEQQDRKLLAGEHDFEVAVRTMETPRNGRRKVAARRLQVGDDGDTSHVFLSLIDDLTHQRALAEPAA
jgi:PAS domain S-box-containing protein